jgi:hypothetical protein
MSQPDFMIELEGTPEDVQAMLNVASRIEGAVAYKKERLTSGLYRVWYRGKGTPNDLVAAIKKRAGIGQPKRKPRLRKVISEAVIVGEVAAEDSDDGDV